MVGKDRKHINSRDDALFKDLVGEVQPIKSRPRNTVKPRQGARIRSRIHQQNSVGDGLSFASETPLVMANEQVSYKRDGISERLLRALRRGKYPAQAELDLHGMTTTEALPVLNEFLAQCGARRFNCIRIVHGKGLGSGARGPVMKNAVNNWLRQFDNVLAFCSAPANDGGTGAVYVYLKRSGRESDPY